MGCLYCTPLFHGIIKNKRKVVFNGRINICSQPTRQKLEEAANKEVSPAEWRISVDQPAAHQDLVARAAEAYVVTPEIMQHVTDTVTPQGIAAVVDLPDAHRVPANIQGAWLLLDRVQDPGNVGTMVRTADAAGFTGVVVGDRSADIFGPKVVRSMQGSQFHLTLLEGDLHKWIQDFKQLGAPVYGTQLNPAAKNFRDVHPGQTFALIMGNEGQGMAADLLKETTANLYIPMRGDAESLNVAVSAGILMFQLNRELD